MLAGAIRRAWTGSSTSTQLPTPAEAIAAVIAVALSASATSRGIGLSRDSINYLAAGQSLANGGGLRLLSGEPMTVFPPLFPLVAAAAELAGIGAERGVRALVVLSVGAIPVVLGRILHISSCRPPIVAASALLAGASPVLLGVSRMAWTEAPFILLVLLTIHGLTRIAVDERATTGRLVMITSFLWAATLLRYAGVVLLPVTMLTLVIFSQGSPSERLWRGFVQGVAASGPLLLWVVRNVLIDGTALGPRSSSPDSPLRVFADLAISLGRWIVPFPVADGRLLAFAGLVMASLITAIMIAGSLWCRTATSESQVPVRYFIAHPAALFIGVYTAYLVGSALLVAFDGVNARLMSPVHVTIIIVLAIAASRWLSTVPRSQRAGSARSVGLAMGALVAVSIYSVASAQLVIATRQNGVSFDGPRFGQSELAGLVLKEHTDGTGLLYSNEPFGLWAATGLYPIKSPPEELGQETSARVRSFLTEVACADEPVLLAQFNLAGPDEDPSPDWIGRVYLELLAEASDGALFRVTPLPSAGMAIDLGCDR